MRSNQPQVGKRFCYDSLCARNTSKPSHDRLPTMKLNNSKERETTKVTKLSSSIKSLGSRLKKSKSHRLNDAKPFETSSADSAISLIRQETYIKVNEKSLSAGDEKPILLTGNPTVEHLKSKTTKIPVYRKIPAINLTHIGVSKSLQQSKATVAENVPNAEDESMRSRSLEGKV